MKRRTARERSFADEWPSRRPRPRWCITDRDDAGRRSPYRCRRTDRTSGSAASSRRRHCRRYRPWRSLARARNTQERSRNPGHTHNRRKSRSSKAALRRWRRPRSHRPRCLVPSHRRPARASRAAGRNPARKTNNAILVSRPILSRLAHSCTAGQDVAAWTIAECGSKRVWQKIY